MVRSLLDLNLKATQRRHVTRAAMFCERNKENGRRLGLWALTRKPWPSNSSIL